MGNMGSGGTRTLCAPSRRGALRAVNLYEVAAAWGRRVSRGTPPPELSAGMGKKPSPKPPPEEPRLVKRLIKKPDGRYLILYEPAKPRADKR